MTLSELAGIAGDILMIVGAIASVVFVVVALYVASIVHKINASFKSMQSGFEKVQEFASIPLMVITALLSRGSKK